MTSLDAHTLSSLLSNLQSTLDRFKAQDPYISFDLWSGCGRDAIEDAYIALVPQYHPDRFAHLRSDQVHHLSNLLFIELSTLRARLLSLEPSALPSSARPHTEAPPLTQTLPPPSSTSHRTSPSLPSISAPPPPQPTASPRDVASHPPVSAPPPVSEAPPPATPYVRSSTAPSVAAFSAALTPPRPLPTFQASSTKQPAQPPAQPPQASTHQAPPPQATAARSLPVFQTPVRLSPSSPPSAGASPPSATPTSLSTASPLTSRASSPSLPVFSSSVAPAAVPAVAQATSAKHLKEGLKLLRAEQFAAARAEFTAAFNADPESGVCSAHLAWCDFLLDSDHPDIASRKLRLLVARPDAAEYASFFLGKIAQHAKNDAEASSHFNAVLKVNPKHVDAQRELRLIKLRAAAPATPSSTSLSSRIGSFFKRLGGGKDE